MERYFSVHNLCFGYLKKPLCLKDVNFSAEKNDRILILALDDKGKTSLLKTLSGFDDKFFGKVFLDGKEIRSIPDDDKKVSVIFDEPILLNSSIEKNLDYICEVLKKERLTDSEKVELLEKFNLDYPLKTKVKKLSDFEKFKLCFLRVFIKRPRVVFIDDILKNGFNQDEIQELKVILDFCLEGRLVFMASNNDSFVKNRDFFEWFNPTKVLYLNNAFVSEKKSIDNFFESIIDLDACGFNLELTKLEGFCVFQDGNFYLSFQDKFVIKIDKALNEKFERLKLAENENEDIVMVFEKGLEFDLVNNNDVNRLLGEKKLMIFSKLDRSRVI